MPTQNALMFFSSIVRPLSFGRAYSPRGADASRHGFTGRKRGINAPRASPRGTRPPTRAEQQRPPSDARTRTHASIGPDMNLSRVPRFGEYRGGARWGEEEVRLDSPSSLPRFADETVFTFRSVRFGRAGRGPAGMPCRGEGKEGGGGKPRGRPSFRWASPEAMRKCVRHSTHSHTRAQHRAFSDSLI